MSYYRNGNQIVGNPIGFGRRSHRRVRRVKGRGLTDYIPGYSYLPSVESVSSYIPGYDTARGVKKSIEIASDIGNLFNDNNIPIPPPLPPVPKSGLKLSRADLKHNEMLRKKEMEENKPDFLETARKYKPIATIDNLLRDFGVRDRVRTKLSQSRIGRFLTRAADTAIKRGYGRKRSVRKKHYGGSKSHKRPRKTRSRVHGGSKRRSLRRRR